MITLFYLAWYLVSVKCPGGTFYNVVSEGCEGCFKGTYQPEDGQLTCLVCPNNTSTANQNSKSIQQCRGKLYRGLFKYKYNMERNVPVQHIIECYASNIAWSVLYITEHYAGML